MHGQEAELPIQDQSLLSAAAVVVAQHGLTGLTLERLATQVGTSRMTLHRREVTIPGILAGLALQAALALREAYWPVLLAEGTGAERLHAALQAICDVAEDHLAVLAGLFAVDGGLFHDPPDTSGEIGTRASLVAPLVKLLRDGGRDGSLRSTEDPERMAALIFNTIGWSYVHLRHSQHWPAATTRQGLIDLILLGLTPGHDDL